jgi:hypothetical protein
LRAPAHEGAPVRSRIVISAQAEMHNLIRVWMPGLRGYDRKLRRPTAIVLGQIAFGLMRPIVAALHSPSQKGVL